MEDFGLSCSKQSIMSLNDELYHNICCKLQLGKSIRQLGDSPSMFALMFSFNNGLVQILIFEIFNHIPKDHSFDCTTTCRVAIKASAFQIGIQYHKQCVNLGNT